MNNDVAKAILKREGANRYTIRGVMKEMARLFAGTAIPWKPSKRPYFPLTPKDDRAVIILYHENPKQKTRLRVTVEVLDD